MGVAVASTSLATTEAEHRSTYLVPSWYVFSGKMSIPVLRPFFNWTVRSFLFLFFFQVSILGLVHGPSKPLSEGPRGT